MIVLDWRPNGLPSALWDIRSASAWSTTTNDIRVWNGGSQEMDRLTEGGLYTSPVIISWSSVRAEDDFVVHTNYLPWE